MYSSKDFLPVLVEDIQLDLDKMAFLSCVNTGESGQSTEMMSSHQMVTG